MLIRTAVVGLPRPVADVVCVAFDHPPAMELATATTVPLHGSAAPLEQVLAAHQPDAVVAGLADHEDEVAICDFARRHHPTAVMAVSADGTQAWTVEVRAALVALSEVSPAGLRDALRSAVGTAPDPP